MSFLPGTSLVVKPSVIFTEICEEEQRCSKKIVEKESTAKTYVFCMWAFGAIDVVGTIAIARTKPFHLMRGVQVAAFFIIATNIVGLFAKKFLDLNSEINGDKDSEGDIKRNYGNLKTWQGLPVPPEKRGLVAFYNYYHKKFEEYSRGYNNRIKETEEYQPPFDPSSISVAYSELNKFQARALVCKVQTAYMQVVIANFEKLPKDHEQLRGDIFTFIDTPFLSKACGPSHMTQGFLTFASGRAFESRLVDGMDIDDIAEKIQNEMAELVKMEV